MADTDISINNLEQGKSAHVIQRLAYTLPDAGQLLGGLSRNSVYRLVETGKLRLVKVGGRSLIPASDIFRLIEGEAAE